MQKKALDAIGWSCELVHDTASVSEQSRLPTTRWGQVLKRMAETIVHSTTQVFVPPSLAQAPRVPCCIVIVILCCRSYIEIWLRPQLCPHSPYPPARLPGA